jgi:hypothetical protein
MTYFKKLNEDGSLNMIGTSELHTVDNIEISESEYNRLRESIIENAVHIDSEEYIDNELTIEQY